MHTFTYTPDPNNPYDHIKSVVETSSDKLEDVLEAMTHHLRAAGFHIDGVLDVVDETTGERKE